MGRFQSTISTVAAIGTIGLTVVAVYRAVDNQKQRESQQLEEIRSLKEQLQNLAKPQEVSPPAFQPQPQAQQNETPTLQRGSGSSSQVFPGPPPELPSPQPAAPGGDSVSP
jgi:hypothetical protein